MTRVRRCAALGLLLTVTAGLLGAEQPGDKVSPKDKSPQEATVVGLLVDPRSSQPAVVLQGKRDGRVFAMVIGPAEATGIAVPLQNVTPPRPLTHDLFLTLFGRLNVAVTKVVITDLRNNIYYATLHLTANGSEIQMDSRPSDAIALAIRAKAPVLVEDRVFEKSELLAPPGGQPGAGQRI